MIGGINSHATGGHEGFIQRQLKEDVACGLRIKCHSEEALSDFLGTQPSRGNLCAAIKSKNNTSNGGNPLIRVRDLIEQPGLADLKIPMCRSQGRGVSRNNCDRRYGYLRF